MHRHSILLLALLATLPGVHSFGSLQYLRPGGTQVPGPAMNSLADNLNLPSNRMMGKPEQRRYNGGVHWVSG